MIRTDPAVLKEVTEHLHHVKYPASKQSILEQCNNMSHIPDAGQRLLKDHLPNRVYNSAEEALAALPM